MPVASVMFVHPIIFSMGTASRCSFFVSPALPRIMSISTFHACPRLSHDYDLQVFCSEGLVVLLLVLVLLIVVVMLPVLVFVRYLNMNTTQQLSILLILHPALRSLFNVLPSMTPFIFRWLGLPIKTCAIVPFLHLTLQIFQPTSRASSHAACCLAG